MDSPSGRRPGSFHWDSTLWHELSHVFVLSATKHRVPRWFTEGMAVHEETAASPDWGDRLDPNAIDAIKKKKLLPVADLDRGFIHPKYPSQVIVSYFQAGRICDYIKENWGYDKLLAMMHDYAGGASTPEVIEKELGLKPEEFDKKFLAALEAATKKTVDGFDEWKKKIREVSVLAKAGKHDEVIKEAQAIRDVYPDYVEAGSAYEFLSDAYLAKGDKAKAMAELSRYSAIGGRSPVLLKKLATLLEEANRKQEAAAVLARLNFIYPQDEELHRRLGDLYMGDSKTEAAAVEYRAAIAMKPLDTATARYNLARALRTAGKNEEAKEELLMALESAPGFRPAQRMLLELSKEESGK
jgi:tetratricopeptide (TPR) repeat protein